LAQSEGCTPCRTSSSLPSTSTCKRVWDAGDLGFSFIKVKLLYTAYIIPVKLNLRPRSPEAKLALLYFR